MSNAKWDDERNKDFVRNHVRMSIVRRNLGSDPRSNDRAPDEVGKRKSIKRKDIEKFTDDEQALDAGFAPLTKKQMKDEIPDAIVSDLLSSLGPGVYVYVPGVIEYLLRTAVGGSNARYNQLLREAILQNEGVSERISKMSATIDQIPEAELNDDLDD